MIGAGRAGVALALRVSRAGFTTVLEDVLPARLKAVARHEDAAEIGYATSIEDAVRDADLVLDTVPDELESKLEMFTLLDRMAPPATLFVTPTQALSIADLASCTYRAGQCFAVQFTPAGTVQLSYAPACEPHTLARVEEFFRAQGYEVASALDASALP